MSRTERRTTRPPALLGPRQWLLLGGMVAGAIAIVAKGVQLQAIEGEKWARIASQQQENRTPVPARRGAIHDRNGIPLAVSYETFRISVAPTELRDPARVRRTLEEVLQIPTSLARRATDRRRRWVVLPGRFTPEQRERLADLRGVHFERSLERFYPQGDVGREILGAVSGDGRPLGGIEQEFDHLLRGTDGFAVMRKDSHGKLQPSLSLPVTPPRDGADVVLTIDFAVQEIADQALRAALERTSARGGDLLIGDPRTGELLAAVSRRPGGRTLTAATQPYEPGSTIKPLFLASLLAERRVTLSDRLFAENGSWTDPNGRTFRDVHPYGEVTVAEALRVSSNVGMAKLSARISPGAQYRYLRDFGFGTPTGIDYPSEASGRLSRPAGWSRLTQGSLSIGYEVSVTPLQLLAAYGALANDGVLMEPHLVRSARASTGEVLLTRRPRPVRQVVPAAVARALRDPLVSVVDDGTAKRAALATFAMAGKTGTARLTGASGRYESGAYAATFVGYFPAEHPQLVIFVKLDRPVGEYYGGATAAPVTREALQAILAARSPSLDGGELLGTRRGTPVPAVAVSREVVETVEGEGTYVFRLADRTPRPVERTRRAPATLPDLGGLALRDAARRVHLLGIAVRVRGGGRVSGTAPAAGSAIARGDTVLLVGSEP